MPTPSVEPTEMLRAARSSGVADDNESPKPDHREQARIAGAIVLVLIIGALVLDNTREVPIGYVLGDAHVRMVYLLLVTALLGVAVGWLARGRRKR